jgi:hypothetical protein
MSSLCHRRNILLVECIVAGGEIFDPLLRSRASSESGRGVLFRRVIVLVVGA